MNRDRKFIITVAAVLLAAILVMGACMCFICNSVSEKKGVVSDKNSLLPDKEPLTQEMLQTKFSAMYDIDTENNCITVISRDYLNEYWKSNFYKEYIRSLSIDEIMYIIQDSIRIYYSYDSVVLTEYTADSNVPTRFPCWEEAVSYSQSDDEYENTKQIYDIIIYRITMLSSPKVLLSGIASPTNAYLKKDVYIPDMTKSTDIAAIREDFSKAEILIKPEYLRLNEPDDADGCKIALYSGGMRTQVYPPIEQEERYEVKLTANNDGDSVIILDILRGTYRMKIDSYSATQIGGRFETYGSCLKLYYDRYYPVRSDGTYFSVSDSYYILRYYQGHLKYYATQSVPKAWIDGSVLEGGTVFYCNDTDFINSLIPN